MKCPARSDIIWRTCQGRFWPVPALRLIAAKLRGNPTENLQHAMEDFFNKFLSEEMVTFVLAMLPISELRGALIYALGGDKLPFTQAFPIAVLGNMIPIPFLMYLLEPGARLVSRVAPGKRFVDWLFARTRARSEKVRKYETLGLILFVAIPLPVTGAWTGTIAAYLCGLKKGPSFLAITCGVCIAGIVVSVMTLGVREVVELILRAFGR